MNGATVGDDAQAKAPRQRLAGAAGLLHQVLRLGQDRAGPRHHLGPRGGENDPGSIAIDHGGAENLLQLLHPGRQRRLGDMRRVGGAAEGPVMGEELEVLELAEGWEHKSDIGCIDRH